MKHGSYHFIPYVSDYMIRTSCSLTSSQDETEINSRRCFCAHAFIYICFHQVNLSAATDNDSAVSYHLIGELNVFMLIC